MANTYLNSSHALRHPPVARALCCRATSQEKRGYSGVVTYCASALSPLAAEADCLGGGEGDIDKEGRQVDARLHGTHVPLAGGAGCWLGTWGGRRCAPQRGGGAVGGVPHWWAQWVGRPIGGRSGSREQ